MLNIENNQQSLLTFRIGPVLCCAPSLPVTSIITPPKLTHPPGSDSANPGIFKHGTHIVKVVDLRQKFGIDIKDQTQPGHLIISIFEKENYAFWVDQILDVFDFPSEGWGNLPAAIPKGIFTRTLLLNKKIHLYSEFEKLAAIPSLGYLEHYINQLNQQNELENKQITKPIEKISSGNTDTVQKTPVTPSIEKISKTPTTIKPLDPSKTTSVKEKPSPAPRPLPINNNSVDKNNAIPAKKTNIKNTDILKAKDTKLVESARLIHKKIAPLTKENSSIRTAKNAKQNISQTPTNPLIEDINEQQRSTTHSAVSDTYNNKEQQGTSIFTILFLLLIIGSLSYSSYYFLFKKNEINKTVYPSSPQHELEITEPLPIATIRNIESDPVAISAEPEIETSVVSSVEDNSIEVEAAEIQPMGNEPTNIETTVIISTISHDNDALSGGTYQAEISQLADEITITVIEPLLTETEMVIEAQVNQDNIEESAEDQILIEKITEKVMPSPVQKQKTKPEIINEIIHIVKKGDTLWAIAKKYVHNPFRYPELARLSNIKNPHRIYPGNRVRIRFIKR
ncbi:MAG: chemotaxis protein CheW [Woeseiaceae bacterium]